MRPKGKIRKGPPSRVVLSREQETLVADLVEGFQDRTPDQTAEGIPDPLCAQALINRLPTDPSVIPLLQVLKDRFPEKGVGKAIRRALFKLKQKGVPTEAFLAQTADPAPILKPVPKDPPLCYVGPIDTPGGARTVALILHRQGKGREAGFGVVSDTEGFQEFFFGPLSKKDAMGLTEQFSEKAGPLVETSLSHVATLLEAAYQRQVSTGGRAPEHYLELRPWLLEQAVLLEGPIIYDMIPRNVVSDHILTDAALKNLFDDPLMEDWLVEYASLRPYMEEIYRLDESPIFLTPVQKRTRIREIQDKCLAQIFTPEKRGRLKYRLEEMAYLFLKLGQEETATSALAAAQAVDSEVTALTANPVLDALLQRSLAVYHKAIEERAREEAPARREDASPLILP
jgi:hypothetical protein